MSTQIIEMNGAPAFAVVPVAEWNALLSRLEDLQDIADAKTAQATESVPAELADRLLAGDNPLRVWRDHRGLTLQALAEQCGVTRQMFSMIEHGKPTHLPTCFTKWPACWVAIWMTFTPDLRWRPSAEL